MTPIARTVTHAFAMLMLSIAVKLECGVAPVKQGRVS